MDRLIADHLVRAAEFYCVEDVELRPEYSGRGMYGETTTAVVCDSPATVLAAGINYSLEQCEGPYDYDHPLVSKLNDLIIDGIQEDDMGKQRVFY